MWRVAKFSPWLKEVGLDSGANIKAQTKITPRFFAISALLFLQIEVVMRVTKSGEGFGKYCCYLFD